MTEPPEQLRSKAWSVAKPAALHEWSKGSSDTTQMLMAASRAVDAALASVPDGWAKIDGEWIIVTSDGVGYGEFDRDRSRPIGADDPS